MTHLDLYMHVQLWAYICGWSTVSWSLLKEQEQSFWGSIYVIFECTEEMSSAPRNSEILLEWCTEECMVNYRGACKLEVHALVLIFDMCNLSSLPPPPHIRIIGTAAEILSQCGGQVDMVVAGTGTGGTLAGIGRKLKEALPSVQVKHF